MRKLLKTGVAVAALCGAVGAHALTDTTNLSVTLTITAACNVTTTAPAPVAFGTHAQTATVPVDTAGSVTVTCVGAVPYNVLLGQGANYSGGRRMNVGANFVPYELYRDSGRTQVWGETIGTDTVAGSGTATYQVYGRVPSLAFPAGTYTDTVLVTVDY
jgi:spore coat protein U-like protein